jgi:hypothetical protein
MASSSVTVTKGRRILPDFAEEFPDYADPPYMVSPISSMHVEHTNQVSQPAARHAQPAAETPKSHALPQDTVTLRTSDLSHDGDSK